MKVYRLKRKQFLPIGITKAWDFFSDPKNLLLITPKEHNFKIIHNSGGDKMFAGQVIQYQVNAMPYISIRWVTQIGHVHEPEFFIDKQLKGPFSVWNHKHHFKEVDGGVEMTDEVDYVIPLGWIGRLAHFIFVERKVNRTFEYRSNVLQDHFGKG